MKATNTLGTGRLFCALLLVSFGTGEPIHCAADCLPPPSGLISWWRAESDALDAVGGNHGTLAGNASFASGNIGGGFVLDGDRDGVLIGNAANLQLQDFSIEAWIKRTSSTTNSFNGNGNGTLFALGRGGGGYGFWIQQSDNRLAIGKLQVNLVTSGATVTDTNWHHVAVTKTNTTVIFYVDGVAYPAPTYNSGGFTYTGPGYIGAWRNPFALVDNSFYGTIDELAVYNRALSGAEIQAIYAANTSGKCDTVAPTITSQPTNRSVQIGGSTTFYASVSGSRPLSYQWLFNDTNVISWATNASLALTNVQPADTGLYSVLVTNAGGSTNSSNALLSITLLRIARLGTNVIVTWPVVASNFVLQASEAVSGSWSNTASPVVVGQDNVVTTPNTGTKFYRLLGP